MRIFGFILGFWLLATSVFAQDNSAIEDVIGGQLEAFNARDVEEAWTYASPNIKRLFINDNHLLCRKVSSLSM